MPPRSRSNIGFRLENNAALVAQLSTSGALCRLDCGAISITLFTGNELEGAAGNLFLRAHGSASTCGLAWTPLLGPRSPTRFWQESASELRGQGTWQEIAYELRLVLVHDHCAWFWQARLHNRAGVARKVDLTYAQDLALAPYGAVRMNEFYVSQYVDHTPLNDARHGIVVASRQNQPVDGRHPWSVIGALGHGTGFATDALQFYGTGARAGLAPPGLTGELPGERLQHEHSMVVIRDASLELPADARASSGFFGHFQADHPQATSPADLQRIEYLSNLPESDVWVDDGRTWKAARSGAAAASASHGQHSTLFSHAPALRALEMPEHDLQRFYPHPWRQIERDAGNRLLSFFTGEHSHVVLHEKELRVQRPHGHLLRTGLHLTPDESALTSTAWMSGVFHSMVTQGHVSINRLLSTVRSYLGLFSAHGLRVFAEVDGRWQLLAIPSAFEMAPGHCCWLYRYARGLITVRSEARSDPHELSLTLEAAEGPPLRFLVSLHVALGGDDGSARGAVLWRREGEQLVICAPPQTDVGQRFPHGSFRILPHAGAAFERVGGDELLFLDGESREQPYLCLVTAEGSRAALGIRGNLIDESAQQPLRATGPAALAPHAAIQRPSAPGIAEDALLSQATRLGEWVPWLAQNAWVHYLAPRGLEQYSGGGWGTRDVCQGPVELLLALGQWGAVRDLLLRVMSNQNPDGDWPQWFMFFERERGIRAGDSHGDIVFWPVLVLAQYLLASADHTVLDAVVPFFDPRGAAAGERATVWQHAERALQVMRTRVIPGTSLAAYGHGDWNDALQPADPALRQSMCSAWTVTLHYQTLCTLARALRAVGRTAQLGDLEQWAERVRGDFQRWLMPGGVLTGYVHFESAGSPRYLLHPDDHVTGVRYSALAMIHAILEDVFTPAQARDHLQLIDSQLSAPDGVRLFDRPLPYHGGLQRIFQRAETATFFGREIGLMYTHAHLRFAQALAHLGESGRFLRALSQVNPIGIRSVVPSAAMRQANCYYSSSDAAFADRYQASDEYDRVQSGSIGFDGGWRVYSSGAGIALGLIVRHLLGVTWERTQVRLDPVMPAALNGLAVTLSLADRQLALRYAIGQRGSGVSAVRLNGATVGFARDFNPHRSGAALLAMQELTPQLRDGANTLEIELG